MRRSRHAVPRPGPCGALAPLLSALLTAGVPAIARAADAAPAWQTLKGKHYIVRFQGDRTFAKDVLLRAEGDYDRITRELGFTRRDNFWLWKNRVRIDVFADADAYRGGQDAAAWSAGKANYADRSIATFEGSQAFLDSVLPHEVAHLIFREFLGASSSAPLWLHEGVAQWSDTSTRDTWQTMARLLYRLNHLMTLESLSRIDIRHTSNTELARAYYAQSASIVGFMIERHGSRHFREFCGHLRDGKSLEDALRFTYPNTLRSLEALESAWRQHLEDQEDE